MHAADIISHAQPHPDRDLPAGWWLLPAMVIGAGMWAGLIYALLA